MFHFMDYIYEIYKEQSFSKAAANLYISQPALSASVRKTEEKIGAPIFDRSVSPIRLTDCGEKYIKAVEEILAARSSFEEYLNDCQQLKTGSLAIGGSNLFSSCVLPPLIAAFSKKYPEVTIHLTEADTPKLMEQLFRGDLDLVMDNYEVTDEIYNSKVFSEETLYLAVPKSMDINDHLRSYQISAADIAANSKVLSAAWPVPLSQFENVPFLFLRSGNDTRSRAELLCKEAAFTPNVVLKLDQLVTAFRICCSGLGATFVSDTLIRHLPNDTDCFYYKLASRHATRQIYFYQKRTRHTTRAMDEFLKLGDTGYCISPR